MSFIATTPEEAATGAVAELYEAERTAAGHVPNYTKLFARRPGVYAAWKQLSGAIKANMELRRYELATLGAATALRSTYCSLAHGRVLVDKFLPADAVTALASAGEGGGASVEPADRAVVDFAGKVARAADQITAADVDALRAHGLSDDDIFDVVLAAAVRCFFSKTLDATGTRADAAFAAMEPALRAALTVGRPIDGDG